MNPRSEWFKRNSQSESGPSFIKSNNFYINIYNYKPIKKFMKIAFFSVWSGFSANLKQMLKTVRSEHRSFTRNESKTSLR